MRKYTIPQNMTVEYMLSDHLGSTSLTTDVNGAKVLELRYKAWGEVRATWTNVPVDIDPAYKMPSTNILVKRATWTTHSPAESPRDLG